MTESDIALTAKFVLRPPVWMPRSNHAGHLIATAELFDSSYISIPGVTIQLEVKAPVIVDSCLYLFSIMRHRAKQRRPIFQLEVAPCSKRTHNGIPPIYGPHLHKGDSEPVPIVHPEVRCGNWAGSLEWFLEQAHIELFSMEDPENVQL